MKLLLTALLLLTSCVSQTVAQRRPQRPTRAVATLEVRAVIYYDLGGYQSVGPTEFLLLNADPERLLDPVGVSAYAVARLLNEPLENAKLIISIGQLRRQGGAAAEYQADQIENLLKTQRTTQRLQAEAAFNNNSWETEQQKRDKATILEMGNRLSSHVIERQVTDSRGVANFRSLPVGQETYLFGMTRTRGGVAVWVMRSSGLKAGNNGEVILDQTNAILIF